MILHYYNPFCNKEILSEMDVRPLIPSNHILES